MPNKQILERNKVDFANAGTGPQAHQWESLSRNRNIIRVWMEIQPGDLSDRYLGAKNSNKDTSEFLTLYPSLNIGGFF